MAEPNVERSWGLTIMWIVVAIICVTGAAGAGHWAYTAGGWADFVGWPLAVLLALGAILAVVGIFTASSSAKCPSCRAAIVAFDPEQPMVVCEQCRAHARVERGALHALPPDYVHPSPIFTVKLAAEVTWAGCVACGADATHSQTLEIKESQLAKNAAVSAAGLALVAVAGAGFVQTGGGKVWRVPIPYCDQHREGVIVDTDFGTPVLRFRSYAAYSAFLSANSLAPSQPATPAS